MQTLTWHIAVKKKMNNKHSQVLLVFRKNPRKWNYGTTLIVGIFKRVCCFDEVFLMILTSTEQLFIERPLCRRFLHNEHLFPVTSVNKFLCNVIRFTTFHLSEAVTRGVLVEKVFLEIFQTFTGKHLCQSLFFNKVAGWGDCFWSFSCLLLKIFCLFHFNKKKSNEKKEIHWWGSNIYFFARVSLCLTSKISKHLRDGFY